MEPRRDNGKCDAKSRRAGLGGERIDQGREFCEGGARCQGCGGAFRPFEVIVRQSSKTSKSIEASSPPVDVVLRPWHRSGAAQQRLDGLRGVDAIEVRQASDEAFKSATIEDRVMS